MFYPWFVLFLFFTESHASNLKSSVTDDFILRLNELIDRLEPQEISDNTTTTNSEVPCVDLSIALQDWLFNFQNNITEVLKETISEQTEILNQETMSQLSTRQKVLRKQKSNNETTCRSVPVGAVCLSTGIYIFHSTYLNWEEARKFCLSKGMDLVAIETAEENAALADYVKTLGIFTGTRTSAWTSGCYQNEFISYAWHSVDEKFTYTNWWPGYPVAKVPGNCVIFHPPDPRWWEVPQTADYPSICEL